MKEEFAMEALCESCPMRTFAGLDCTELVNRLRIDPEDVLDRNLVVALPTGSLLLSALAWPRPDRCDAIREALPKVRRTTARWVSATACMEMYLISEVYKGTVSSPETELP